MILLLTVCYFIIYNLFHTLNKDDHLVGKKNASQLQVLYYDMDIFLFAVQLLGLIMFLVDVEVASQMQVKMLKEKEIKKTYYLTCN